MPVVPTGETFLKVGEWLERTPPLSSFHRNDCRGAHYCFAIVLG